MIASRIGGLPEVIRDRENGLLVDNTPEAVAAAIRELCGNPELARQLGHAGRQTIAERFTVDRMAGLTMEAYRKVLGNSISGRAEAPAPPTQGNRF